MKTLRLLSSLFAFAVLAAGALAADPSGVWKWTVHTPNGDIDTTLKLELKAGKLAGAYSNQFGDANISHASLKGDVIAFDVLRNINGDDYLVKYHGRIQGDTIKGTIEAPGHDGGEGVKLDWDAKRVPSAKSG
jgi:carbon monoxide dehydrogenase subunit G